MKPRFTAALAGPCPDNPKPLILFISSSLLLTTLLCLYNYSSSPGQQGIKIVYDGLPPSGGNVGNSTGKSLKNQCNLFSGDWVPYAEGPYYTNATNCEMDDRQNCMKFGRPDTEFLKWRWKPYECELPLFDATEFLELMRGKSMAFIGDSLARNQLQSLLCMLASVADPIIVAHAPFAKNRLWFYAEYNFTLAFYWSFHLVRSEDDEVNVDLARMNVYLDEVDKTWATQVKNFNFLIISSGQWFLRPLMYYEKGKLVGCYLCKRENITDLDVFYGYKMAFRTSLSTLLNLEKFKGITFLRTFTPSHYENGLWNEGGTCSRTRPTPKHEMKLSDYFSELHSTQVAELTAAETEARRTRGPKFRMLEITEMMTLRPDGHPSYYGHPASANTKIPDCAHWCLPGPIDTWNEALLQMLKTEREE